MTHAKYSESLVRRGEPSVTVRCPGKVNLFLSCASPTPDGYHPLVTVFEAVDVYETVTVSSGQGPSPVTISLEHPDPTVPTDESNLAVRAARRFMQCHGDERPLHIHVHKNIPAAGGMAGGSADAAATLRACHAFFHAGVSHEELDVIARQLGADVPFLLTGGVALATGRGDIITPIPTTIETTWVLAFHHEGLSTPMVFREFDRLHEGQTQFAPSPVPPQLMDALASNHVDALAQCLHNDLEEAACRLHPAMKETLHHARQATSYTAMVSGSGPTVAALVADHHEAQRVQSELEQLPQVAGTMIVHGPVTGAREEN